MKKKIVWGVIILIVIGLVAYQVNKSQELTGESIKIGVLNPDTGPGATTGYYTRQGINLAVEEINNSGGINGKELVIVYEDSQTNPTKGVSAFNKITDTKDVSAVISFLSSVTVAVSSVANESKIPLFVTVAAADSITDNCEWCVRYFSNTREEGVKTYEFISTFNPEKIAILHSQDDWGNAVAEIISNNVKKDTSNTEILIEKFQLSESDYRTQLLRIKEFNPDLVFFNGYEFHTKNFYEQMNNLSIDPPVLIVHVPALTPQANLLKYMNGDYVTNSYFYISENKKKEVFLDKYLKKYNEEPSFYSSFSYDIIYLIKESIENSKSMNNSDILYSAKNLGKFSGVNGDVIFDGNNHASPEYGVLKVEGDKFIKIK